MKCVPTACSLFQPPSKILQKPPTYEPTFEAVSVTWVIVVLFLCAFRWVFYAQSPSLTQTQSLLAPLTGLTDTTEPILTVGRNSPKEPCWSAILFIAASELLATVNYLELCDNIVIITVSLQVSNLVSCIFIIVLFIQYIIFNIVFKLWLWSPVLYFMSAVTRCMNWKSNLWYKYVSKL